MLLFRIQAGAEEVEEYLENGQSRHGEQYPQEPGYLGARDHAEEDHDRRHVERLTLYSWLQHVAFELLDYQVEQGRKGGLARGDREGDQDRRYGTQPGPHVGYDRRDRDPGAEQEGVGDPQQVEEQGRDAPLYDHVESQPAQVSRQREPLALPQLGGVPPVTLRRRHKVGGFDLTHVGEQVDRDEEHPEEGENQADRAGDEADQASEDVTPHGLGDVQ